MERQGGYGKNGSLDPSTCTNIKRLAHYQVHFKKNKFGVHLTSTKHKSNFGGGIQKNTYDIPLNPGFMTGSKKKKSWLK